MLRYLGLLLLVVTTCNLSSTARAVLTKSYDPNINATLPGGGNLTTDSATGLQWLVPTIQPQLDLDPYPLDAGFRYATRIEVYTFLTHLGLPTGTYPVGGSEMTDSYTAAVPYIGYGFYDHIMFNELFTVPGLTGDVAPNGLLYKVTVSLQRHWDWDGNDWERTSVNFSGTAADDPFSGHWMVRAVPEPNSILLLTVGALIIVGRTLRRRYSFDARSLSRTNSTETPTNSDRAVIGSLARSIAIVALLSSLLFTPRASAAEFVGLGDLPGGAYRSKAFGVSADGTTIVGYSTSSKGSVEAFRWRVGKMTGLGDLGDPQGFYSHAYAASADGSVIVGWASSPTSSGFEAFRWTQATGLVGLGDLPTATAVDSLATGVSDDGQVIVGYTNQIGPTHAFRWTPSSGMTDLGSLSSGSLAGGRTVSGDGTLVVGASGNGIGLEAFYWTQSAGMVGIGDLPGNQFNSHALDVSADGRVIVGLARPTYATNEAFRWTSDEGMIGLGDLPGGSYDSQALGVSADGNTVVGASTVTGNPGNINGQRAFIWEPQNGMQNLANVLSALGADLTDWTLIEARAISDDGRVVVGWGLDPHGVEQGWRAILSIPGDASGDGVVDGADYTLWADNFLGNARGFAKGDLNLDGLVDGSDYTLWADHFLNVAPYTLSAGTAHSESSIESQVVPEPSAWVLTSLACLCLLQKKLLSGIRLPRAWLGVAFDMVRRARLSLVLRSRTSPRDSLERFDSFSWLPLLLFFAAACATTPASPSEFGFDLTWVEPLAGGNYIDFADVSADGSIVVGMSFSSSGFESVRWTRAEGLKGLGTGNGQWQYNDAQSVSGDGAIIAGFALERAFVWTETAGFQDIGTLKADGNIGTQAYGISGDGSTVVGNSLSSDNVYRAFRWQAQEGMTALTDGTEDSFPVATSEDGTVVVGGVGGRVALVWVEGIGQVDLGKLPDGTTATWAAAVSADGSVVVGQAGTRGFRWTADSGMQALDSLPAGLKLSGIVDASSDGSIVLGSASAEPHSSVPILYLPDIGCRSLIDVLQSNGIAIESGVSLLAQAISQDGRVIVGRTVNSDSPGLAFVATIPLIGDATFDGIVDGTDYVVWADNFLLNERNWGSGDFNCDGFVDGADYTIWADRYAPAATLPLNSAVPEPSTLVLAGIGAIVAGICRSSMSFPQIDRVWCSRR